jgi:RNA polymerase sigma-70 factor (ECF subfamily)
MGAQATRFAGNDAVFEAMGSLHGSALHRWALAWSGDASDAWDLVQDAFERALRHRPPVADDNEMRRWLLKVMRNRHLDHCRALAVRSVANVDVATLAQPVDDEELPRWRCVDTATVRSLLPKLSSCLRATFLLHIEGRSGSDIARRLSIHPNTVASRVFRARRHLQRLLAEKLSVANDNEVTRAH